MTDPKDKQNEEQGSSQSTGTDQSQTSEQETTSQEKKDVGEEAAGQSDQ